MDKVQCVVAGAGSVGLAIARKLSQKYETIILESCKTFGTQTSSRNSEVLHRGIYYKKNSLKARFCVDSVPMMYDYLSSRCIPFNKCGKLIVATTPAELMELNNIHHKAIQNGVSDIYFFTECDVRAVEPGVCCLGALWSPSTGVFDSYTFMQNMLADAEQSGAILVCDCRVDGVSSGEISLSMSSGGVHCKSAQSAPRFIVSTSHGPLGCDIFVNACGLHAVDIATKEDASIHPIERVPPAFFLQGNYYKYCGGDKPPFSHLVYPCPDHSTGALGIHATIDMAGSVKFGPDAVWVDLSAASVGAVDTSEKKMRQFENSVRRYFPSLGEDCLQADYAGIRPKLVGPSSSGGQKGDVLDLWGRDLSDFVIEGPAQHGGARGLVNLYGIESPGLTSSLRIADYVDSIVSLE